MHNLIVAEAVALLGCLIAPGLVAGKARKEASLAAIEVNRVIRAAELAYASKAAWPADEPQGRMPDALISVMPLLARFDHGDYLVDWDHWTLSDGPDEFTPRTEFAAVSVVTPDRRLARNIATAVGAQRLHFSMGDRLTFVIAGAKEEMK
jgi:hypothetical protein